jgi:ribonuclease G
MRDIPITENDGFPENIQWQHSLENRANMQDILVNWSPQETRVAVVENGTLQELHVERRLERGRVGNIYMGKIVRVLPGMQSAFVDIGLERAAFLHVGDLHHSHQELVGNVPPSMPSSLLPIEKQIFEGQSLMVQVLKDPIGAKGARLTTQISIAGQMLVFLPNDQHIGVSQKIGSVEQRDALKERLMKLLSQNDAHIQQAGFILRTNAEDATDEELKADIDYLGRTWLSVREMGLKSKAGSLIHEDLNLAQRVLRDLTSEQTNTIRIDAKSQYESLLSFAKEYTPNAVLKCQHYQGEKPIFDLFNIDSDIQKALARRVDLKSGGYLIIDQTEALTTIDVNTGGYVGVANFDDTIFKTNLEAAQTIARQLRLRNLGGIIIIDFIDMVKEEHQRAVLEELRKQMLSDRVKTTISGFTQLGLIEMTRKRTRESLARILCEVCPMCKGTGHVLTARSVCYDILRDILREARQFNPQAFRVIAAPAVIEMLLDEESQHLATLSDFIGKPISLSAEAAMLPERFDIVLL